MELLALLEPDTVVRLLEAGSYVLLFGLLFACGLGLPLPEDIPLLALYFAQKYARRMKKPIETIPARAMNALTEYHWPGNVRELENFIERAVILTRGIELELPVNELRQRGPAAAAISRPSTLATLEHAEREHIVRALTETAWVIGGPAGAAARLGMKRTTLQSRMRKLGITRHH